MEVGESATYNYIFAGAGAAGLMLAYRMLQSGDFNTKQFLLIDKNLKNTNDRTWCFWEEGEGEWDTIITKKWDSCLFKGKGYSNSFRLSPFSYKMIKGIDFYEMMLSSLSTYSNVTIKYESIQSIKDEHSHVSIITDVSSYKSVKVFNSIFDWNTITKQEKYPVLQQHFIGWFVETEKSVFNADTATFMDFDLQQNGNTRFMYVLPETSKKALLEYTLFSEHILDKSEYENAIKEYLNELGVKEYRIAEKEQGSIPMTVAPFSTNTRNILNIGTAGGWTKASTGFTFSMISRKTKELVPRINESLDFTTYNKKTRFWYYDLWFLDVLTKYNHKGGLIFTRMFKRNAPRQILRFLDEQTHFFEELRIMFSLTSFPFFETFFKRLF
ncbi:lycopene cyclase family protein [Spongiivirga citrea]|uniref:Lycopene cyclase n=1 Tax=Spongiivirga citrea TaxID=1481457 RepID=A0A6M0CNN4_9FLAO|nr:lycopene cyclase family protein [Spongiivirga citrea]NER17654.1 lycopene cyclase [Spongiivirga citrea]